MSGFRLPFPPREGRGEGVLFAERGTNSTAWPYLPVSKRSPQDPLTPTLSRREREQGTP